MPIKKKNHYVPRFILNNFTDDENKIYIYNKSSKKIIETTNSYDQCQKGNFYSKKTLKELDEEFSHISINPIFTHLNKDLEDNFDLCVERKFSSISKEIIDLILDNKIPNLDDNKKDFIKEYCSLQHIRTLKFKFDMQEINEEIMTMPENVEKLILEESNKKKVLGDDKIKEIIKTKNPKSNHKERRKIFTDIKRKIKKNPSLIEELREKWYKSDTCKLELDKQKKIFEESLKNLKENHDLHTANIVNESNRNSFFEIADLNNKHIQILYIKDENSFVIPDTGILLTSLEFKIVETNEVITHEYVFYLQIHPKILIKISYDEENCLEVKNDFISSHNKLCKDECLNNIYSNKN